MRIQVENVSVWAFVYVFVIGFIVGAGLNAGYERIKKDVAAAEATATTATNLLSRAECPANVFQEKTIMLPDGGVYKCGAVRTIPVNQRELNKWYKAEAKLLLKKKVKK